MRAQRYASARVDAIRERECNRPGEAPWEERED